MYIMGFTSLLAIILVRKAYKLIKNKRSSSDYQEVDDEFIIMVNEGDLNG